MSTFGARLHAAIADRVRHRCLQVEGVAGLREDGGGEGDGIRALLHRAVGREPQQPVDRIAGGWLGDRQLV